MMIARPNAWVSVDEEPATVLTYAPRVDPAPLTVSVPGRDPTLGALVVVITNGTPADVQVSSVTFTITVGQTGPDGPPLTPTGEGVKSLVSDTTNWSFDGPTSQVTSGSADYVLGPQTGSTVTLAAGASVYVEIYDFQTAESPSTSTVTVEEVIADGDPTFTNIGVSTFPDGFFFDSLAVTVPSDNALTPVAQVAGGTGVTLTWNTSLVDARNQTVYWSSPTSGQQQATPTKLGEWSTPPDQQLTSDTVFVVVVRAQGVRNEWMTASLATAVSVLDPALVASSASVSGALSAGSVQAASATVSGGLEAGTLTAGTGTFGVLLAAGSATVNMLGGPDTIPLQPSGPYPSFTNYVANTDGMVIGAVTWPDIDPSVGTAWAMACGTSGPLQLYTGGTRSDDSGPKLAGDSFVLPVAAGAPFSLWSMLQGRAGSGSARFTWMSLGSPPAGQPPYEQIGTAEPVDLAALGLPNLPPQEGTD
ncbi:MAG TPA: hypothetical protein VF517_18405 [Thermoleophilaceae bacterium]|jgi:hypothetical protein